jgi:hypothetical protein
MITKDDTQPINEKRITACPANSATEGGVRYHVHIIQASHSILNVDKIRLLDKVKLNSKDTCRNF